jgi:hypothetical protein
VRRAARCMRPSGRPRDERRACARATHRREREDDRLCALQACCRTPISDVVMHIYFIVDGHGLAWGRRAPGPRGLVRASAPRRVCERAVCTFHTLCTHTFAVLGSSYTGFERKSAHISPLRLHQGSPVQSCDVSFAEE